MLLSFEQKPPKDLVPLDLTRLVCYIWAYGLALCLTYKQSIHFVLFLSNFEYDDEKKKMIFIECAAFDIQRESNRSSKGMKQTKKCRNFCEKTMKC